MKEEIMNDPRPSLPASGDCGEGAVCVRSPVYFRLTDNCDPEERVEEAALWKALHDEFGDDILPLTGPSPEGATVYGRPRLTDHLPSLRYWDDPAFLAWTNRPFCLSTMEGLDEAVHDLHERGLGAFVKSTRDKHAIFRIPVGTDPRDVIGDWAYSFIDGGPRLMVQGLADITYEWRFFCVDRVIVADSPNAAHLTPLDFPQAGAFKTPQSKVASLSAEGVRSSLLPVAQAIAQDMETEDAVIDCAFINGKPGCVELNPMIFGGVGLFACNVRSLARALRRKPQSPPALAEPRDEP